ncbi:MAG: hypothetical protein J6X97_03575 [Lachnospiraceae bacterium]|nr:hypothetical protein [Lachnospiraceae bacterium]
MVSRRNLVTIILMMMTIFFMFQFTQVVKVRNNRYDTNLYAKESVLVSGEQFKANAYDERIIFIGDENGDCFKTVKEWCEYSKRYLFVYSNPSAVTDQAVKNAHMVLIDSKTADIVKESKAFNDMAKNGTTMVFLNFPEAGKIKDSYRIKRLLGITGIVAEKTEAKGFQVFDGFLLGGEAAYMPQKEEEEKYNDFAKTVPWYKTGKGSVTYAVAMMDEEEVKANDFPKLIWRNNYKGTFVYAVAADVINSDMGLGFLSAIDYSANDFTLYPVVNAQNMVISDYPAITSENEEIIKNIYSMDSLSLSRDITWPVFISIASRYNLKLTGFVNTGYDYNPENKPSDELLEFYLKQLKEIDGEMGRSLEINDASLFKEKMAFDEGYLEEEGGYHYSAAYVSEQSEDVLGVIRDSSNVLERVHTVVGKKAEDSEILSYIDDSVTYQSITNVADEYSYRKELTHRCMLTAIGYSTTLIDMHKVMFPESNEDEWQNFSKEVSANINTFWAANKEFDYTAASESDTRVREFLNLKYDFKREGNEITISTEKSDDVYYVLRTHGEKISKTEGAEATLIEEDAYLIHAKKSEAKIYLDTADEILKYDGLISVK